MWIKTTLGLILSQSEYQDNISDSKRWCVDITKKEHLCTAAKSITSTAIFETSLEVSHELKLELPYGSAIPLLDLYPQALHTNRETLCSLMLYSPQLWNRIHVNQQMDAKEKCDPLHKIEYYYTLCKWISGTVSNYAERSNSRLEGKMFHALSHIRTLPSRWLFCVSLGTQREARKAETIFWGSLVDNRPNKSNGVEHRGRQT